MIKAATVRQQRESYEQKQKRLKAEIEPRSRSARKAIEEGKQAVLR